MPTILECFEEARAVVVEPADEDMHNEVVVSMFLCSVAFVEKKEERHENLLHLDFQTD